MKRIKKDLMYLLLLLYFKLEFYVNHYQMMNKKNLLLFMKDLKYLLSLSRIYQDNLNMLNLLL
jgi:hypothetical protein